MALTDAQQQQLLTAATARRCILGITCVDGPNPGSVWVLGARGMRWINPIEHNYYATYDMYLGGAPTVANQVQLDQLIATHGRADDVASTQMNVAKILQGLPAALAQQLPAGQTAFTAEQIQAACRAAIEQAPIPVQLKVSAA